MSPELARSAGTGHIRFTAFDLTDLAAIPDLVRTLRQANGPLYGLVAATKAR